MERNVNNERFNAEAPTRDGNPYVHAMNLEAWKAIQKFAPSAFADSSSTPLRPDVLEIGCGTGLLSLQVAPVANRIVAIDAADGMIDVLSAKLSKPAAPKNIIPLAILLEDPEDKRLPPADDANPEGPRLKYDLITSHLALHHIPDIKALLTTMIGCLKEGGLIALTDFEDFGPEARRFHAESKMEGVERHGIPREWMASLMREAGFKDVKVEVAWDSTKMVEKYPGEFKGGKPAEGQGELKQFTYVICIGRA